MTIFSVVNSLSISDNLFKWWPTRYNAMQIWWCVNAMYVLKSVDEDILILTQHLSIKEQKKRD